MRTLTIMEINETSGGIVPFIIAVVIIDIALISATTGIISGAEEQAEDTKDQRSHKCTLY